MHVVHLILRIISKATFFIPRHFKVSLFRRIWKIGRHFLPLQNKILFSNFHGRGFGDDPMYIAIEIHKRHPRLKLYWAVSGNAGNELPSWITPVPIGSFALEYHYSTARIWVLNIKTEDKPRKRKGQFYIQTWHGGILGLKQVEKDVEDTLPVSYLEKTKIDSQDISLMYSDNDLYCKYFREKFWYDGEVIKCDIPRVSVFLQSGVALRESMLRRLGIPKDKKIVMYAPTFRKKFKVEDWFVWDYEKIRTILTTKFKGDFVFLVRLHPDIAALAKTLSISPDIVDVTMYHNMQDLLVAADVLISDFSSSMFEYGLLSKKPVFCIAKDYDQYVNSDRRLMFDIKDIPFSFARDDDELGQIICEFDEKEYFNRLDRFAKLIGLEEHGKGAEKIADIIEGHIR